MRRLPWLALALLALAAPPARSAEFPQAPAGANPAESLAASLRALLLEAVPNPLYEDDSHWGQQKMVASGVKWRGQGLHVHPEPEFRAKNHGRWAKVRVTADHPAEQLTLEVRDVARPQPDTLTFTALLAFAARVDYERQVWDEGRRLYSGEVRARVRLRAALRCEVVTKVERKDGLLPETVFRFRVRQSDVGYEDLVVEHVAGVGGEAAKLLGEAVHAGMRRWHPSLERRLLDRANAAIVKAGDTKEVRVGVSSLLGKK